LVIKLDEDDDVNRQIQNISKGIDGGKRKKMNEILKTLKKNRFDGMAEEFCLVYNIS
jgi:hypothetical protein